MNIPLKMNKDFEKAIESMQEKYGEDFEFLNGIHETQLNFSDFIDGFIDKNVADVTIDSNANASTKDIRSLLNEKGKSHDKLFAFNKIFYEMKKKYNLRTAKEWLETEYNGGFYLHDAPSATFLPYCFHGDTKIITNQGMIPLRELSGQTVSVLNRYGKWEQASVRHFGKQKLMKLSVSRGNVSKEFLVTPNHKWFVYDMENDTVELTTDHLKPGMKLPFVAGQNAQDLRPSFAHLKDGGKAVIFRKFPPLSQPPEDLYGWLAGYFATYGNVDKNGICSISTARRTDLLFVQNVLCVLGFPVAQITCEEKSRYLTGRIECEYRITIPSEYLTESFFLLQIHKEKWCAFSKKIIESTPWVVTSVEDTGLTDDVYCAVTQDTQSFTLEGNLLTHNCYAYDLTRLATEGLFFLKHYNNQPPKHLTTFIDDVIEFISYMSNRSSGEPLRPFVSFPMTVGVAYGC